MNSHRVLHLYGEGYLSTTPCLYRFNVDSIVQLRDIGNSYGFWSHLYDFLEFLPVVCCLVCSLATIRTIERSIGLGSERIKVNTNWRFPFHCYACKARAKIERIFPNARHAVGDGDGGKAIAIIERILSKARHTVGDGDGGKARATIERTLSNARHAIGDVDGGKARTTRERIIFNVRHAIGDGDGGKARATRERTVSNARHTVGDDGILTANN